MVIIIAPIRWNIIMVWALTILRCITLMAFFSVATKAFAYDVIAFGDSVTSGYYRNASGNVSSTGCGGGAKCGGAIPILERYLDSQVEPSNVYNWGWPGEKTGSAGHGSPGGIYRLPGVLNTGSKGDVVLLMEGLNDIIHYLSNGDIVNNMETMVKQTKSKNMIPILGLTTPNSINGHWYTTGKSIINPALARMADRVGVPWVDHWRNIAINSNWNNNHSGDYLHLNNAGNTILAKGWLDAIKNLELIGELIEELSELNAQILKNNTRASALLKTLNAKSDAGNNEVKELIQKGKSCARAAQQSTVSQNASTSSITSAISTANKRIKVQKSKLACAQESLNAIDEVIFSIENSILDLIMPLLSKP